MLSQMNASPDVLFVARTLHIVHCKVVGDIAEERLISRLAVKVSKLPADNHGFIVPPTVVTDRLTVEHKVALVRSGSPDQLDLWYVR
jgi:hypothetical protein